MNWDAISAVGEIMGAGGVIVTLIYLASQLRQNTKALRLNSEVAAAQEHVHNSIGVSGTNVPYIVVRGFGAPTSLTPEESAQFLFWLNGSMRMYQHQHLMFIEGNLSESSWTSTAQLLKGFVKTPGFQSYWSVRRSTYSKGFQDFVDAIDASGIIQTNVVMDSMQMSATEST
jgi:hypothetical protein